MALQLEKYRVKIIHQQLWNENGLYGTNLRQHYLFLDVSESANGTNANSVRNISQHKNGKWMDLSKYERSDEEEYRLEINIAT